MSSNNDFFNFSDDSEIPLIDLGGLSALLAKSQPAPSLPPKGGKENRTAPRYLVRWRCTVSIDSSGAHHGQVKNISLKGAAILHEQNFQSAEYMKLHIYVPPPPPSKIPCIIAVLGKIVYSSYDPGEHRFKSGIIFLKFGTEGDTDFLDDHLKNHGLTVLT